LNIITASTMREGAMLAVQKAREFESKEKERRKKRPKETEQEKTSESVQIKS